jgi:acetolactate synthase-1/3 small subunit
MNRQNQGNIVAVLVENKPGVLFQITNMLRRRDFNIESISAGAIGEGKLSRITIEVKGDERTVDLVVKNLYKLYDTLHVDRLNSEDAICREVALVKINVSGLKARSELKHYARRFRARIVDVSSDSMVIEITSEPKRIGAFLKVVEKYGVKETARTGITALSRGSKPQKAGMKQTGKKA